LGEKERERERVPPCSGPYRTYALGEKEEERRGGRGVNVGRRA